MFQFTGLAHLAVQYIFNVLGCPIRKSSDIMLVCSSPKLIAAYHVLHRLSEPRHPPYALCCFKKVRNCSSVTTTLLFLDLQLMFSQYVKELIFFPPVHQVSKSLQMLRLWISRPKTTSIFQKNFLHSVRTSISHCGEYRSRTDDPLRARQML